MATDPQPTLLTRAYVPRNAKQEKMLAAALGSGEVVTLNGHKVKVEGKESGPPLRFLIRDEEEARPARKTQPQPAPALTPSPGLRLADLLTAEKRLRDRLSVQPTPDQARACYLMSVGDLAACTESYWSWLPRPISQAAQADNRLVTLNALNNVLNMALLLAVVTDEKPGVVEVPPHLPVEKLLTMLTGSFALQMAALCRIAERCGHTPEQLAAYHHDVEALIDPDFMASLVQQAWENSPPRPNDKLTAGDQ